MPVTASINKRMPLAALIGSVIVGGQVAVILLMGETACLNQGCKVVEELTTISPLLFNLLGFAYFQVLFWVAWWGKSRPSSAAAEWIRPLLLAGLSVEGVLLSYQFFVAHAFCSFCFIVFLMVLLLNALAGRQQFIMGAGIVISIFTIFSLLSFGPSLVLSRYKTLDAGTFAVKTCSSPMKELYLVFSSDCPHCQNVITALESCNSCNFHFNPVDQIKTLNLPDLEHSASYSPEINRLILTLLGIQEIPVVIVKNPDGFSFIKGENNIINYIEKACFQEDPMLYIDRSQYDEQEKLILFDQDEGVCAVSPDCE